MGRYTNAVSLKFEFVRADEALRIGTRHSDLSREMATDGTLG